MAKLIIQAEGTPASSAELNWGLTRVGRGSDNDIVVQHASVSYHHCEFELGLDYLSVRDCDSTNGTFLNGQKIREGRVEPGQKLRLGLVAVTVEWSKDPVVVPKIESPRPIESVELGDGVISCRNHPTIASVWHCATCRQYFCSPCTRGVNLVGRPMHRLCPLCSSPVELAPWMADRGKKRSLWGRVKKVLSRTMRMK